MNRLYISLAIFLFALGSQGADMTPDIEQGRAKAAVCSACHGADGNSINSEWPSLAGQHAEYLVQQLNAYKSGTVVNALMSAQAAALSDQDMVDLAAYYSSLQVKPGSADAALVDDGSSLYRLGDAPNAVASCAACHGPRGRGNPLANVPAVAGQRSAYVVAQLKAFAAGTRPGGLNGVMADVSKNMTDQQMKAVASYMQGLH